MRIALGVEYNGSGFFGYQLQQAGTRTVQGELEKAISSVADEAVRIHCAGRTDTGVHATGQVIDFTTSAQRELKAWTMGVNTRLPRDVCITWARQVADDFSARFSATARSYRYVLLMRKVRPGILPASVAWSFEELDVDAMHEAAQALLGEQDFSSFRAAACQARHARRCIHAIRLRRSGPYAIMDITANAFLHHMVRNIMGSLMVVGRGQQPVGWIAELLAARDRRLAGVTAPPGGLYLVDVAYPAHFGLPEKTGWLPEFG